jgi:hypothetical protein
MLRSTTSVFLILASAFSCCGQKDNRASSRVNYDSLRLQLEIMYDDDQEVRRILLDSIGVTSPAAQPYFRQIAAVDSINRIKLLTILDTYGILERSKIGAKAADAYFLIIQHSDTALMVNWLPELKRLSQVGEADRSACAMMEDRLRMYRGQKQIYGTQAAVFRKDKVLAIWPVEDPMKVNERRREVGLPLTVEQNAKRLNAVYNADEPLP